MSAPALLAEIPLSIPLGGAPRLDGTPAAMGAWGGYGFSHFFFLNRLGTI